MSQGPAASVNSRLTSQVAFCICRFSPIFLRSHSTGERSRHSELRTNCARAEFDSRKAPTAKREVFVCCHLPQRRKLPLDLVRRKEIIRIQPLDVVSLAEPEGMVMAAESALVLQWTQL